MDIFDRVKMLAKRDGISISDLENKLGFGSGSLYPHNKDATIKSDRVVKLADYFNVTTDWLLTGESGGDRLSYGEWELIGKYRELALSERKSIIDYLDFIKSREKGGDE